MPGRLLDELYAYPGVVGLVSARPFYLAMLVAWVERLSIADPVTARLAHMPMDSYEVMR